MFEYSTSTLRCRKRKELARAAAFTCWLVLLGADARGADAWAVRYGMNLRELTAVQADKTVELGATTVRVVFGWDVIEPACKGCFVWTRTDAWMAEARRTGLDVFGTLAYSPGWANGGHSYNYPPRVAQDWYDYVLAVVQRYPDVRFWGVWNEPNLDVFFKDGDLRGYEVLVSTAYAAIRAGNPGARILGPEVSHHAIKDGWYVAAMRAFGALFDIVTVHWYPDGPELGFMMDEMVRPSAGGKPIWLTETGMGPCEGVLGEAQQLAHYNRVLATLLPRRAWWSGLLFYDLYDPPEEGTCGSAILRTDYSNRAAFTLYQRFIRAYR